MAPKLVSVDEIKPGRIDYRVIVRVLRLWIVPDFNNPRLTNSVEMVLIDDKNSRIHGTIRGNMLKKFQDSVKESNSYALENFFVTQDDNKFKTTTNKFKLGFIGKTRITEVSADRIPIFNFNFVPFIDIMDGCDEEFIIDVIGHITGVGSIKDVSVKGRPSKLIEFVLEDLEDKKITCTLWEQYAENFVAEYGKMDPKAPVITILQLCKAKTFKGKGSISNAYHGTKLLLNPNISEDVAYKNRLLMKHGTFSQSITELSSQSSINISDDFLKTDRMTTADIIESINECQGSLLAKIIEIENDKNWWYESCPKCFRKVKPFDEKFFCDKCDKFVIALPRFKVQVRVIDEAGSTSLLMFDNVVTNLVGKTTADLLEEFNKDNVNQSYPSELDVLIEKEYLFMVDINAMNIVKKYGVYTVKRISDDEEVIKNFKVQHSIKSSDDEDEMWSIGNINQHEDETYKESMTDDSHMTCTPKATNKGEHDVHITDLTDDGAVQMSTNQPRKKIKVKKD